MKRTGLLILVIVIIVLAFVGYEWRNSPVFSGFGGSSDQGQLVAQAHYQCDQGKTIDAAYYQGPEAPAAAPGQMPTPTGFVKLNLSDGRTMTLKQTISADGTRYSDGDPQVQGNESFVFWSKGNGALVLEHNQEQSYTGCIKVAANADNLSQVYANGANGFSIRYPSGYTVDDSHVFQLSPSRKIPGVKFTIDPAMATGTNLGSDTYIAVEQLASTTPSASSGQDSCTADKFIDLSNGGSVTTLTDGATSYSYASSTGAGAGNRYEEQVFALPGTNPCVAVRYFIHWGVIENYPQGAVREFNKDALTAQFDAIRRSLILNQ